MEKVTKTPSRKADHIRINLEEEVSSNLSTGFENYHFLHEALPDLNLDEVDLSQTFFNKQLNAPILISSMTGGTEEAKRINQNLAMAAQKAGIAMGVGSQRAAIEDPNLADSFNVRPFAPDILLIANLGAVQLNYGYSVDECAKAVDMIQADALILHLNALQEAVQPEGDTNFKGLLQKIETVCKTLPVPVIAKEVGWGISASTARRLADAGVSAIDVAGAGGTSWSQVEMYRAKTEAQARLAAAFINWGIPTSESIQMIKAEIPEIPVIASGGIKSGIDIAKSIALGAEMGAMAGKFLKAANQSSEAVTETIDLLAREIKICMFGAGVGSLPELKSTKLIKKSS